MKPLHPATTTDQSEPKTFLGYGLGTIVYAVLLGVTVGFISGYYEKSFTFLAEFWHKEQSLTGIVPTWLLSAMGLLLACPILYFIINRIPEKRQHNPADIITGIHIHNGQIHTAAAIYSALASVFSIGFGFSVGYYAPTVLLGAGIGGFMHRLKYIQRLQPVHLYISIGAGAAAAIAAIFHAPIGAVVFVHEVLLRFFSIRAFAPITISAVTAYIISNQFFDKLFFFDVPGHYIPDPPTYLVAAITGVLAALTGIAMIKAILKIQQHTQQRKQGILAQLFVAAALTGIVVILVPEAAGNHLAVLQDVISGSSYSIVMLLVIFMAKWLATTVAFGYGVPGGIFGPTIFIGAALGGLVAGCIEWVSPDVLDSQQIIIITTMAAMISAVLGAPIAMTLIIMEITGDFQIVSVIMLAVVMANITAYRLMGSSSFFDIQLKSRGFNLDVGRDQLHTENSYIDDLISDDYIALHEDCDLLDAEKQLLAGDKNIAFVIDDDNILRGQVRLVDIEYYRREVESTPTETPPTISTVTHTHITMIYRATSVWQAMQEMTRSHITVLPVVDGEHHTQLLGVVYNNALAARYFEQLRGLRQQENVGQ